MRNLIKESLPETCIEISSWLPRKDALELASRSHVLCQIGARSLKGSYSGKIFDYLGLRRNILIAPSDNDVMAKLVNYTNAGVAVDTIDDAVCTLNNWYLKWRKDGYLPYHGINERLMEFSRESQASYVGNVILKELDMV